MPHPAARRALAAAIALAAFSAVAQPMYRWVDDKGVTHFSQEPPPDGRKASKVEPKVVPRSSSVTPPRDTPEAWKEKEADFRRRQVERSHLEEQGERMATKRADRCAEARRRIGVLEAQRRVYRTDHKGEKVYLSDEERAKTLAEQQAIALDTCN